MKITREFVERIPKTDLHLHLDGSIRLSTLIELAKEKNIKLPSYTEEGLRKQVFKEGYKSLAEYFQGFAYTTSVLQDPESLQQVAYELALDNIHENVRYIEVRFAPQLHQNPRLSTLNAMKAVNRGLKKAKEEFNAKKAIRSDEEPPFEYGIIVCAMRMFEPNYSEYFDTLLQVHHHSERKWIYSLAAQELVKASLEARDKYGVPVVGCDLAGAEKGYPAVNYREAFDLAHKHFLKKTVHAGEDYGPESIFQAITELNADRIGHGVHLFNADMIEDGEIVDREAYVENLVRYIGDRRITIEVCLTSNLQTNPEIGSLSEHSFGKMREAKLSVTFCTDNRTVSSTTVTDEILKAVKTFNITAKELKNFVIYGCKRNFYPGTYPEKREYVRKIINYYETIEKEF